MPEYANIYHGYHNTNRKGSPEPFVSNVVPLEHEITNESTE